MNDQIIKLLQSRGLLNEDSKRKVEDLLTRGKTLEQAVVGGKYVSEVDFTKTQAEALGLAFVDLANTIIDPEVVSLVPKQTLDNFKILPLKFDGQTLEVVLRDAQDFRAVESLEFLADEKGWKLKILLATPSQFKRLSKNLQGLSTEVETALEQAKGKFEKTKEEEGGVAGNIEEIIKGAPVSRIISIVMRNAVEAGASDIHIEPVENESRIRYRIDGVLRTALSLPIYVHPALISRVKVLANLKIDETRIPQDGRITQSINGKKIDFRISTLPVVDHEKVVMRILDTTAGAPTLENLGFRKEYIDIMKEEIKKPHGMFLITGPTGSGKSTTLFAALSTLNADGVNISTLEDPVEYFISGVNQSQIRPEIGYTFATGLRALLRQDPNVVMVGEIRDRETAELAIHASLTGHLIFSTLHTNDVYGLVPRLIDMQIQPFLLAATLNLGVAQRLARKICESCKTDQEVAPEVMVQMQSELKTIPKKYIAAEMDFDQPIKFYHGAGCNKCGNTGYSGRTAAAELFQFTPQAQKLVEEGFPADKFKIEFERQEMMTLRQDLILKAVEGKTTLEEVLRLSQQAAETE
ncbi:MAG: GspE/PulE family protein [Patescibacteria group bacterium]|nr:GspE/PulE family protein [Patescibacteria group bacterium]